MKFILFVILVVFFIVESKFADAGYSMPKPFRCQDSCKDIVDFSNIELAIKRAKCNGKVNLDGFRSAFRTLRSLVCECNGNDYTPRRNECVKLYNCDMMVPVVQRVIPLVIDDMYRDVRKNVCEIIQVYIDFISNTGQNCVGGALSFQGDTTYGKQVEYFTDTCYNSSSVDLLGSVSRFNQKVSGAGETILNIISLRHSPVNDIYYGPQFRQCWSEFAGHTIDICGCGFH